MQPTPSATISQTGLTSSISKLDKVSRTLALYGVVLPLLMIGLLKFTQIEVQALVPLISGTPWLAWLYPAFGETGTSYLLGAVELFTALLLIVSPWSARAAIAGGLSASLIFFTTVSMMFVLPIWEAGSGGFPWLNFLGTFLIKDIVLLGVSLVILTEGLQRLRLVQSSR